MFKRSTLRPPTEHEVFSIKHASPSLTKTFLVTELFSRGTKTTSTSRIDNSMTQGLSYHAGFGKRKKTDKRTNGNFSQTKDSLSKSNPLSKYD